MKRALFFKSVIIFFSLVITAASLPGQTAPDALKENIEFVRKNYDFNSWKSRSGQVIPGIRISREILPQLAGMDKLWAKDNYQISRINNSTLVTIRNIWNRQDWSIDISMTVATSFAVAAEYLVLKYAVTSLDKPGLKSPGRDFNLPLGDVCFVNFEQKQENRDLSVDFIRDNVVFMIRAGGRHREELVELAFILDENLQGKQHYREYSQIEEIPVITRFSLPGPGISYGQKIPLVLEIKNPAQAGLDYHWTMSGGGIEKDFLDRYVYYAGDRGEQQLTLTLITDRGLYTAESIEFIVK